MDALLSHASEAYAVAYFGLIIGLALIECVVPRRPAGDMLGQRWIGNFGLSIIGAAFTRLLFPIAFVEWSRVCQAEGWGLLSRGTFPGWAGYVTIVFALDFSAYAQHYLFHRFFLLWRIHRAHHTDHDYDFSTSVRFHPFEAVIETATSMAVIAVIGGPPAAVLVAQLLLLAATFLEHANVRIPPAWDRALRLVIVTPEMHRIHHSQDRGDSRGNLSTIFSWWDRLFGTYVQEPAAGQEAIVFGVAEFKDQKHVQLPWMLAQPFLSQGSDRDHRTVPLVRTAHPTTSLR